MKVQDDRAGSAISSKASLLGLQMAVIFPCPHRARFLWACTSLVSLTLLIRTPVLLDYVPPLGPQFSSVQSLSRVRLFVTRWITARQASLSITNSRAHPNSCPSSRWCHPAISSSVIPFSSCPQSLPSSGSFPMSQLFTWGGQSTGVSALESVLPMNTQDWSLLGWTGWISLQSKRLSRVFSNTTVQKHQFFGAQPSSQSNSHIHTWPLEKP